MRLTIARELDRLERYLGFLATVGSTAPFIGLFGTVWGIRMIDGKPTKPAVIAQRRGELISSIDSMQDGTVVLSTFNRGQDRGNPGSLWKLVATGQ